MARHGRRERTCDLIWWIIVWACQDAFFPPSFFHFLIHSKKCTFIIFQCAKYSRGQRYVLSLILLNMRLDVLYRCAIYWLIKNDFLDSQKDYFFPTKWCLKVMRWCPMDCFWSVLIWPLVSNFVPVGASTKVCYLIWNTEQDPAVLSTWERSCKSKYLKKKMED